MWVEVDELGALDEALDCIEAKILQLNNTYASNLDLVEFELAHYKAAARWIINRIKELEGKMKE